MTTHKQQTHPADALPKQRVTAQPQTTTHRPMTEKETTGRQTTYRQAAGSRVSEADKVRPNQTKAAQTINDLAVARFVAGLTEFVDASGMPAAVLVLVLRGLLSQAETLLKKSLRAQAAAETETIPPSGKTT